jgi:hypothetical protein
MKGKSAKGGMKVTDPAPHDVYAGRDSNVVKDAEKGTDGFKHGGKTKKAGMKAHGGMAKHHAGRKPRKAGGGVFSSAGGPGEQRKPAQHY